ncbi:aldo/keto reductase [Salinarchaeum sp. Harcht-Bsk1]|uniref:aldo/keto reductase n=1 Tax=Salinarchaeum sp. Harcht-Bsk1 TaxID=1333523 RepID=UPI0003424058|nr:aldo/keto reductase [Salinarchaeum sp. Harcht-Bsk1]AGN01790.1 aldo/keto reductase [Salinarchaeum sp. Harcht-Bsk1]
MATAQGTWAYRDRHGGDFGLTFFRRHGEGVVSSIGLGTYLGDPTDEVDDAYREAIVAALQRGCNVLDTAINYRCQRSERVIGEALAEAADAGAPERDAAGGEADVPETADAAESAPDADVAGSDSGVERESVLVATKGGFLPFDGERPDDPGRYVRETFVEPGIVDPADLAHGAHAIAPAFLDDQLDRSLANLGLDTIDLYYVHNPETQLDVRSREAVYDQLEAAFERLEERRAEGDIRAYGVASWDAFRVPPEHDSHLSLPEVIQRARRAAETAGAQTTGFRAIQLPFNAEMADAFTVAAHEGPEGMQSALHFAQDAGLSVFTSASIGQGELAEGVPEHVAVRVEGDTPAQRAINFARSAPGVTSSLVGASSREHAIENVRAGEFDPLGAEAFDAVFASDSA